MALDQLATEMVLPNKITKTIKWKCPESTGVLRVTLFKAEKLINLDSFKLFGSGISDPKAILQVGAKKIYTKTIPNTLNPEWNFTADFPVEVVNGQSLNIEIIDRDTGLNDGFLGKGKHSQIYVIAKLTAYINSCLFC